MSEETNHAQPGQVLESFASFGERAKIWLAANMDRVPHPRWDPLVEDDDHATHARMLQAKLWEGGFAGICYPTQYGGLGLTHDHQRAFDRESAGYQLPFIFSMPTHCICGPTILDCGTEEQKQRYILPMLQGKELWVQFMSEPSGGSDMAGVLTTAVRDGDEFVINGSKVWSTYAYRADYAIMLARTDWTAPKHRGLTMFIVPIHHPKTTIVQIEMIDGTKEFCQEYFDDVDIPAANVVGAVNDGWTVASRLLYHEKISVGALSPFSSVPYKPATDLSTREMIDLVTAQGREDDLDVQRAIGQFETLLVVRSQLNERIGMGMRTREFPDQAGSMARIYGGIQSVARANMAFSISGFSALFWDEEQGRDVGIGYLQRQARCIGGGTIEIARNVVAERVLGMPREPAPDRDLPFSDVPRGKSTPQKPQ